MKLTRLKRIAIRILEHPRLLFARLKGINFNHSFSCYTVKKLLKKQVKTFIDIGANKGDYIKAFSYVFPNSKIYAFEPQKEFKNHFKKFKNVTFFDFGLWDKEGRDVFYKNKFNRGASSFLKPTEIYGKYVGKIENLSKITVVKKRFDNLNIKIESPSFVKIDVEGGEEKVLKGFGERLSEIDILQIELLFKDMYKDKMKLSRILSLLEKFDFSGFIQVELDWMGNKPYVCDLIFFKDDK